MKKTKFKGKLGLKKETIAKLNESQMSTVQGGERPVSWFTICKSCNNTNPACASVNCTG